TAQPQRRYLLPLITYVFLVAAPPLSLLPKPGERFFPFAQGMVRPTVLGPQHAVVGQTVDDAQPEIAVGRQRPLILGMNVYQMGRKRLQGGELHGDVVYIRPALARGRNDAADDRMPLVIQLVFVEERFEAVASEVENRLNHAVPPRILQRRRIGPVAHDQP